MKALRKIRRVMLISPPLVDIRYVETNLVPPLGIAYLGAFVRDRVEVKLLDALVEGADHRVRVTDQMDLVGMSYDEIIARVREYQPELVGLSCVFSNQFASVKELARRIKTEVDPEMILVTGGTHPSFLPEHVLQSSQLDYVVLGEGELTFRALIEAHNRGRGIEEIDGLAYRDNGAVRINPRIHFIEDLDELPFPARDLLPMEEYFKRCLPMSFHWKKKRNTPIMTSRGCPCQCAFCSSSAHWGKRYRFRSPENVLAEMEHLKQSFGIEELKFQDDNLTLPRSRAEAIFQGMIDRGLDLLWNTPNGVAVWTLDEDLVRLMKKSGCYEFTLAVESGDQRVLDNIIKKPLRLEKVIEARRIAKKHGIITIAYFIIGLPGETMENIQNTLRFARELKLEYYIPFIYSPLPGSELWEVCVSQGYINDDYKYEDFNNYFVSGLKTDEFDAAALSHLQSRAYFINLLKLPFRNPREFVGYYSRLLRHRPGFLRHFLVHVRHYLTKSR